MTESIAPDSKVRVRDSFHPDVLSFRLNLSLLLIPQMLAKSFGTDKLKYYFIEILCEKPRQ